MDTGISGCQPRLVLVGEFRINGKNVLKIQGGVGWSWLFLVFYKLIYFFWAKNLGDGCKFNVDFEWLGFLFHKNWLFEWFLPCVFLSTLWLHKIILKSTFLEMFRRCCNWSLKRHGVKIHQHHLQKLRVDGWTEYQYHPTSQMFYPPVVVPDAVSIVEDFPVTLPVLPYTLQDGGCSGTWVPQFVTSKHIICWYSRECIVIL